MNYTRSNLRGLKKLMRICPKGVTPESFYRGSSPEHSPGFPLKHAGMTDFGKERILRSKLPGIQPTEIKMLASSVNSTPETRDSKPLERGRSIYGRQSNRSVSD